MAEAAYLITGTRTLRQRRNGEIAFFDGSLDGASVRIQTKVGDPIRCTVEDGRLVPLTAEAAGLIAALVSASDARETARVELTARLHAESAAQVDEIMGIFLADARAEGATEEEIAAEADYIARIRADVARRVDDRVRTAQPWGDPREILKAARTHVR